MASQFRAFGVLKDRDGILSFFSGTLKQSGDIFRLPLLEGVFSSDGQILC